MAELEEGAANDTERSDVSINLGGAVYRKSEVGYSNYSNLRVNHSGYHHAWWSGHHYYCGSTDRYLN
jgi:hypothetical protein